MKIKCLPVCKMRFGAGITARSLLHLCQFVALASHVLAAHSHIKLISENFCHILTWEAGSQTTIPAYYRVQYFELSILKEKPSEECLNTTRLSCDLTDDFSDHSEQYVAQVEAFSENGTMLWRENGSGFIPDMKTTLGPPTVHISACNGCFIVTIQPPVCHLKSSNKLTFLSMVPDVYPELYYNIALVKASNINKSSEIHEYETVEKNYTIRGLLPRTNYCISVNATATINLQPPKPSLWQCAVTGPFSEPDVADNNYIPAVISGIFLTSFLLLLLAVLYKGGFICLKWIPMPRSLHEFPSMEQAFCSSKDQLTPEPLSAVKIDSKGVKKKMQECNDEGETDSEEDDGYPEYTHHFRGRPPSSCEHSSTSTNRAGDSLLGETSNQESTLLAAEKVDSGACQPVLNEDGSVGSVHFAPLLEETCSSKLSGNCSNFNVNLNSVLLGDSEGSCEESGSSQVLLFQDLEKSFIAQVTGALQCGLLCEPTALTMGTQPLLSKMCPLHEAALSTDSEESDSDVDQDFGYMKRK
ncbi:interferon alpha/beta receptor 2 [Rhinatrema bivittatum]|uniref:interferon alpha/beta receptor 2 n=1 Tax=Rhinatrema bivittatum TaxID=194408 RepID=UPI00112ED2F1|nr:interferon alpha/beta receptor 2 [Rhinatrema bivittatum]XP_029459428.1 interferon alpha/beta receptor 2 [Rhinatrema bivittatum]